METIKIGTKVIYRPAWGTEPPKAAVVEYIEKCANKREKCGDEVDEISWEDKDYGVYTLDDGHWCYGYQIDNIVKTDKTNKRHKVVLEHQTDRQPLEKGWNLVTLELLLSDDELEILKHCMETFKDSGTLALHRFTHCNTCTKYHKYRIWNTLKEGNINITIIN